jgi:flagellar hook-associated protein 1 FlgK
VQLVGGEAATLTFNAQGTVTPNTVYDPASTLSALGSIKVSYSNGGSIDLTKSLKSGKMAAYVELRDVTMVQAQNQLDQFAASISSALSDKTTAGTATGVAPAPTGSVLNLTGLQTGNTININYTDITTNSQRSVTIVRVDDPSVLPLPQTATNDPNDTVVGIDFSGASGSITAQLNAALNASNLVFSGTNPLTVVNNPGFSTITSATTTITLSPTQLTGGSGEVPLFTDTGSAYTGAITANGLQMTGLAQRLAVNGGLITDPSRLVVYSTSTLAGDTLRTDFITKQLTTAKYMYSPQTGVGSTTAPYKGNLLSFMQQFTSQQGAAAQAAAQLSDGQDVVLNTLQQKFTASSGVNIDEEMAHLLSLQNAYSANARVMSTVNQMYQTLMQAM